MHLLFDMPYLVTFLGTLALAGIVQANHRQLRRHRAVKLRHRDLVLRADRVIYGDRLRSGRIRHPHHPFHPATHGRDNMPYFYHRYDRHQFADPLGEPYALF